MKIFKLHMQEKVYLKINNASILRLFDGETISKVNNDLTI